MLQGTAVRDGLDAVADQYASELSVVGGATTSRLRVLDVATPADYGRVMSYLEKVSSLQSVDVESLERGTLTVRVAARGDARVLQRVLALGGVLRPDSAAPGRRRARVPDRERGGAPHELALVTERDLRRCGCCSPCRSRCCCSRGATSRRFACS